MQSRTSSLSNVCLNEFVFLDALAWCASSITKTSGYLDEFENGIEIYSGRKLPADNLNKIGKIMYKREWI